VTQSLIILTTENTEIHRGFSKNNFYPHGGIYLFIVLGINNILLQGCARHSATEVKQKEG
jgi:hypothetical protein